MGQGWGDQYMIMMDKHPIQDENGNTPSHPLLQRPLGLKMYYVPA